MRNFTKNIFSYKLLIIVGIFLVSPSFSLAQSAGDTIKNMPSSWEINSDALKKNLEVQINPQYPAPSQNVSIKIASYLTDLNRSQIYWYVDNTLIESGVGRNKFEFNVGDAGDTSNVDIVIKTSEGYRVDKRITFNPVGIDILWEADTYTPPFYKGKSLASPKSFLKIVAIPNFIKPGGGQIDKGGLIYTWKENGSVVADASGYGKNVFYADGPKPYGDVNIEVLVSSFNGQFKSSKSAQIKLSDPEIVFYKDSPIVGTEYANAIGKELDLSESELAIKAEPYFFSKADVLGSGISYKWSLNNKGVENNAKKITFRREEGVAGVSKVGLSVVNLLRTFQNAAKSFVLNFENANLFDF